MKDIAKMKRERQKLIDAMRAITATAEAREDKKMTEQEAAEWQRHDVDVQRMAEDIKRAERENQLEAEGAGSDDNRGEDNNTNTFKSLGEFLSAVVAASVPGGTRDNRLVETRAATGMNTTNPADGGFLVQDNLMAGIMQRTYDSALIASRCRRIGIGANSNALSWLGLNETSRATGSRFGGVRVYWSAQASTASASTTAFKRARMELEKLMAFVYTTEELLQDSTGLENLVNSIVGEELAFVLDDAIMNGTGAGIPLGVLNSDALVTVAKENAQPADTIVYENVIKMWSRLWTRSAGNSVWFINQDVIPQLSTMALVVGAGGVPVYLPASGASGSPYSTLFGRPIVPVEQAKTIGDVGDIVLADMSQYLLIDKGGINRATSMHVRFLYDEQVFRFTYRVNGQPTWEKVLTPANGSNTVSPFIALAAR